MSDALVCIIANLVAIPVGVWMGTSLTNKRWGQAVCCLLIMLGWVIYAFWRWILNF